MISISTATDAVHGHGSGQPPRLGGLLWRVARVTTPASRLLAGKRWNPIFAIIEHRGRRTGRLHATTVAARRSGQGFVVSLAFGARVDWYRNVLAANGGTIHWRGHAYPVTDPETLDPQQALNAFHPIQRFLLRLTGIDGFILLHDATQAGRS